MSVRAVTTALLVLETVAEQQPCGLSDLARRLDLPKTTVQRALITLAEAGWIRLDNQDVTRWVLAGKAFTVGSKVGRGGGLRDLALPVLNRLQVAVGETIHLMVPDGDEMVLIERLDSAHAVRTFQPLGARAPLHASSNGKSVLAYLPDVEIERYLAHTLPAVTRYTTTDAWRLRDELRRIRLCGYAIADEELNEGIVAVAACIRPNTERPIGSLSISAPKARVPRRLYRAYGDQVAAAAGEIAAIAHPSTGH